MIRHFRTHLFTAFAATALQACAPDAAADRRATERPASTQPGAANPASAPAPAPGSAATAGPGVQPPSERSSRRVIFNGIDFTGVGYDRGDPAAPIVIVDFSDFGCPYCGSHSRQTLPSLEREFIAAGRVFYKYVPLVMGMFPNGNTAARAAECAAEEGKFWPMHDRLYASQQEWRKHDAPATIYRRYAGELGLEPGRFAACLADGRTESRTKRASELSRRLGIRATPTFVVDGEGIEGALPLDAFRTLLLGKLAR